MKFLIITHVPHLKYENDYFAYSPYVNEMNIWAKYATELIVVAPLTFTDKTAIDSSYIHPKIKFLSIDNFDVLSLKGLFRTVIKTPKISWQIFRAMRSADHIHLRCPGNIGLLGCLVQIAFPSKPKTVKYAGNWDPKSQQPWTYKLQKWILSNTFLTRNMTVLVYGEWEGSTKNIKPFFTATYSEAEKTPILEKTLQQTIDFVFVGALVSGKNPLYAIQLVQRLFQKGYKVKLTLYGDGKERKNLEHYCYANQLNGIVILKGNQNKAALKKAYQESHFVILPSKSEGWPKAIAEGMFWGCVPISTPVSCVPYMLDKNNRGILLNMNFEQDILQIETVFNSPQVFDKKQILAANWSRNYTLEVFENEIKKMLLQS
ncbi:glycosyltransferase [Flavobacterium sp. P4023]|uniref:Glycosyltransferase n=1 Tax=Flavobacterium flabelliforme TaxID=2816119 RepID=A0ABS5CPF8_9FLAO|nr:glycosyltransferase [Flavobacterium flabelliforme]MBP4140498.1 glycosyltransferase [Flavobacterium flabelliforme]